MKFLKMEYLLTVDGKSNVSYLADIFVKLNILNQQHQGENRSLVDAKAKIFGFITFIKLCRNIYARKILKINSKNVKWFETNWLFNASGFVWYFKNALPRKTCNELI